MEFGEVLFEQFKLVSTIKDMGFITDDNEIMEFIKVIQVLSENNEIISTRIFGRKVTNLTYFFDKPIKLNYVGIFLSRNMILSSQITIN